MDPTDFHTGDLSLQSTDFSGYGTCATCAGCDVRRGIVQVRIQAILGPRTTSRIGEVASLGLLYRLPDQCGAAAVTNSGRAFTASAPNQHWWGDGSRSREQGRLYLRGPGPVLPPECPASPWAPTTTRHWPPRRWARWGAGRAQPGRRSRCGTRSRRSASQLPELEPYKIEWTSDLADSGLAGRRVTSPEFRGPAGGRS